jgi:hypothetical protein
MGIQPPPDPLSEYAKIAGIKSMQLQQQNTQQEMQQRAALDPGQQQLQKQAVQEGQIAIQNRQAGMKAMQQWDGNNQNDLPGLISKNGGDLNTVMAARTAIVKQQTDMAAMTEAQLNVGKVKSDYLLGKLQAASDPSVPDAQLHDSVAQAANDSVKAGYLDPQHAQGLQQIAQQYANDPAGLRSHLALFEKSLQSQSVQFAQTQKTKETEAAQATAQSRVLTAQTGQQKLQAEMNPQSSLYSPSPASVALGTAPGAAQINAGEALQAGKKSAAEAQAKQPIDAQTEVMKQLALQKMAPAALGNVKPNLIAPASSAFEKAGVDYATAYQSAQNMEDFIKEAKSGNKEAVKIVPLQGALEITTAQGVHRINRTEVDQYGGAGSTYDKLAGAIGGVLTGKNITDTVLNDMDALQKTVSQNAGKLHANKVSVINQAYGSKFEPMKFDAGGAQGGGQSQSNAAPSAHVPGGKATGLTEGATGKGSDGKPYIVKGGVWVAQ